MKKAKLTLCGIPFLAIGGLIALTGCGNTKYDATLVVYNWADYIYDGTDEDGNIVGKGINERFRDYYKEKTGLSIKVQYETFGTPEIMYQQIKAGSISPDLICPSDYMIQKMANENMLEKFSYNEQTGEYGKSLSNWDEFGSQFIKDRFSQSKVDSGESFLTYSIPYFWGTMGFTYDPNKISPATVSTWEVLWSKDSSLSKKISLKDSMRDTYVAGIFHVYKDEIAALDKSASDYNAQLNAIFNRCDDETISKVEAALIEAKKSTVYGFEVDEGKDEIVKGTYYANLAWSGDSVYSMDSAEDSNGVKLNYALPEEGSNVWFDGWCMPKGAQKELAEEYVNFICAPENAALCMESVGYTSPIVGEDIWELVNDWYAAEDGDEVYTVDLSYFFGDSIEGEATIDIPVENAGRQFDAQYPTEDVLNKCCIMKDFGSQTKKVSDMWARVKGA